jgi:hypothetical protein
MFHLLAQSVNPTTAAQPAYSVSDLLTPYMPVFYTSFLITLILTPIMRALAHRHGVVDDPDGKR